MFDWMQEIRFERSQERELDSDYQILLTEIGQPAPRHHVLLAGLGRWLSTWGDDLQKHYDLNQQGAVHESD